MEYKEKILPSGENIVLSLGDHPHKPFNVTNWLGEECRWSIDFKTEQEAVTEFERWN